jgi:nitroimidazol reductase NimA-like FMN-containing flavoprotein (pyridoxamine 5'-phosphate oxidase superfamily)
MKSGSGMGTILGDPELFSCLQNLFESQRSAALATQERGQPYLSLMAFAATPDLKTIVLATDRYTRKYANLMVEPRVALLMDNRSNSPQDTQEAVAVTALGEASEATAGERKQFLSLFVGKHPQLQAFATSSSCALIAVRVISYVVVQHFGEVREIKMG